MPLKLDVQRILVGRSERVKSVDFHPTEPWVLSALYSGNVVIWNYETEVVVRTFEVSEVPVRCAKFVVRKNWIICGSDDMMIRAYNYNTCEKVKEFEAHTDYIRTIVAHPSLPFVLSGSDDMSIKLWDWDKNWENTQIFEGHTHYIMQIEINPKDTNSFASASLDRSIKVWGLNSGVPHFQLEGHERGVNCVSYYPGGERPFLISGADDNIAKVWDYQTKTCVANLEGHTANISAVMFHPQLPIIITGAEDGSIKIWHSSTYRLETTLHYGMQRAWALAGLPTNNRIAIGYDDGTIVIKLGQEEPVVSMDSNGNVIWARNHEIQLVHVLRVPKKSIQDGETLPLSPDDLGSVEFYPSVVTHNKNGQLVTVCGDGEYTIYTARQLRNKSFGNALDFVWSDQNNVYATRESTSKVKIFHQFKEAHIIKTSFEAQAIFGGHLLGVRSNEFIDFYSWEDGRIIRRIEVTPNQVYWSDNGSMVALVCDDNYYVLRYNEEVVNKYISQKVETDEQGIEPAFTLDQDINETVTSAFCSGEIFIYTNQNQRLNYYVGGQVITLTHLDRPCYILGYLLKENRVYLIDRRYNILSFELLRYVLGYQASIVRGDLETASTLLKKKKIPPEYYHKLAQFLESQGHLDMALEVSTDTEHQFELALQLKKLGLAKEILLKSPSLQKWKQLGDLALAECDFVTVEECAKNSNDLSMLFLLYTSTNDAKGLYAISQMAIEKHRFDIAFNSLFILGRVDDCIQLLMKNDRIPEAAFMARSYSPTHIKDIHKKWKSALSKISSAAAQSLGDQTTHPDHFVSKQVETNEQALDEKQIEVMKEVIKQQQIESEKKQQQQAELEKKQLQAHQAQQQQQQQTKITSPRENTVKQATVASPKSSHGKKKSEPVEMEIPDDEFEKNDENEFTNEQQKPEEEDDDIGFGYDDTLADEEPETNKGKGKGKEKEKNKKDADKPAKDSTKTPTTKNKKSDFLDLDEMEDHNTSEKDEEIDIEIDDVLES